MSKRFGFAAAVLCGVLGAVLAGALPARAQEQGFTPIPVIKGVKSLEIGLPAPDFTVKDLDGKTFTFGDERTKRAHLLVFWSIFCEPCREEMPVIQRIADEYTAAGSLDVLAVNMDGEPFIDGIKGFLRQYKYNVRVLLDELDAKGDQFAVADPFQVAGTPVMYLVDAAGNIAGSHLGRISEADLRALITRMLAAK
ncbi:MAG: TlpA family protein disulfide reductase [Candidatus Methylomirabilia bacterium]